MTEVKISSKNQIVVPREAREALEVKSGDHLLVVVRGKAVIMFRKPPKHSRSIRGIAKGGHPRGYLKDERAAWNGSDQA